MHDVVQWEGGRRTSSPPGIRKMALSACRSRTGDVVPVLLCPFYDVLARWTLFGASYGSAVDPTVGRPAMGAGCRRTWATLWLGTCEVGPHAGAQGRVREEMACTAEFNREHMQDRFRHKDMRAECRLRTEFQKGHRRAESQRTFCELSFKGTYAGPSSKDRRADIQRTYCTRLVQRAYFARPNSTRLTARLSRTKDISDEVNRRGE